MRLLRFCPLALRALAFLLERGPTFLRLSWIAMLATLLAGAVSERFIWLGGIVDLMARGVFVVAWMRLVAEGELPSGTAPFRLGRREIFTALGWMVAETFVTFPAHLIAASLGMATGVVSSDLVIVLLALAHAVLGVVFLLPSEAALEPEDGKSWQLPEMVMAGGVAVSLAAFLAWLPGNLLDWAVRTLPALDVLDGITLAQLLLVLVHYLAMALMGGTMALVWKALSAEKT